MRVKSALWFSAEFNCPCGSRIGVETFAAVVDGPGLEIHCRHCRQGYIVTREGAVPITEGLDPDAVTP